MAENPHKLYYSIKEVAQQINVTESLLLWKMCETLHIVLSYSDCGNQ